MNGGVDREINFKAWKSMLIRDGVGPYLSPRRLIEKVQHTFYTDKEYFKELFKAQIQMAYKLKIYNFICVL